MDTPIYELRETADGYVLMGGRLTESLTYPLTDGIEYARRMVGFLEQIRGAEFRVYDAAGALIETKTYRSGVAPTARKQLGNV